MQTIRNRPLLREKTPHPMNPAYFMIFIIQSMKISERSSLRQWEHSVIKRLRKVLVLGCALLAWCDVLGQPNEANTIGQEELKRLIFTGQIAKINRLSGGDGGIYLRDEYLTKPEHQSVSKKYWGLVNNDGPHYYFQVPQGTTLTEVVTKLQYDNYYQERIAVSSANDYKSPSIRTPTFWLIGLLIVIGVIYFIPSIIGYDKQNATAIIALNILLGWTFVGWVVALVWALTKERNDTADDSTAPGGVSHMTTEVKDVIDELERLHKLKEKGVLTDDEFQQQKERLLSQ